MKNIALLISSIGFLLIGISTFFYVFQSSPKLGKFTAENSAHEQSEPPEHSYPGDYQKFSNHRYQAIPKKVSWHQAKRECVEMGGYLACITSDQENRYIAKLASGHSMWIGGTDEKEKGKWEWVSGEPFDFQQWFPGEPNYVGKNSHYIHIAVPWHNQPQEWNDAPSNFKKVVGYICEWDE